LTLKLFPGAVYNSYQMSIYAQVYDSNDAFTIYQIAYDVTVLPDISNLNTLMQQIINMDTSFISNLVFYEGNYVTSLQEMQRISALLNEISSSDKYGLILNTTGKIKLHQK